MARTAAHAHRVSRTSSIQRPWRCQDLERALIQEGSEVVSDDLERLGSVRHLIYDPSGHLLGFNMDVVVTGATIEVPAPLIASADDGALYLCCVRQDLEAALAAVRAALGPILALPA